MCEVPQGSILGPKLFFLCISNICRFYSDAKYILFADDTSILCSSIRIKKKCNTRKLLKHGMKVAVRVLEK